MKGAAWFEAFWCAMGVAFLAGIPARGESLGSVTLVVQDEEGRPVSGAEVHCVDWVDDQFRETPLGEDEKGISDGQGRITFRDRTIGQVFVRVQAGECGGWYRVQERGEHPEALLTIGVGRTARGTVRDSSGQPLAGVMVLADGCLPAGETDESGRFTVSSYGLVYSPELVFVKNGYTPVRTHVHFEAGEVAITLKQGVDLRGVVVTPDDTPAVGSRVSATIPGASDLIVDEEGRFVVHAAPVDEEITINAVLYGNRGSCRASLPLAVREFLGSPVVLRLEAVEYGSITGRMRHAATGEAIRGKVMLDATNEFYSPRKEVATDKEGRFTIERLERGTYWLFAAPARLTLYQVGGPLQVHVDDTGAPAGVELKVAEGCMVKGRVLTADGAPVIGKQVMWEPMSYYRAVWTDKNGYFLIPYLDGDGVTYTIEVRDDLGRCAKATAGPLKKGDEVRGIELRMPPVTEAAVLYGTVSDTSGKPVPNVRLELLYDSGVEPRALSAATDEKGVFDVKIVNSGTVKVSASLGVQIERGGYSENLSRECEIIGGNTLVLDNSKDQTVQLAVKPALLRLFIGRVIGPGDTPIQAHVSLVQGEYRQTSATCDQDGRFVFQRIPEEPFWVEVTAAGYKAQLLRPEEFYADSYAAPTTVKLEPGPFARGESVWAAVTGTPPTEVSVKAHPLGEYVRTRETMYYLQARQPKTNERPPSSPPRRRRIRVVDEAGKPITRVFIEPRYSIPSSEVERYKVPVSAPQPAQSSEDGIYEMPPSDGVMVSAPGRERVYVAAWRNPDPDAVFNIVLGETSSVELKITDAQKRPLSRARVYTGCYAWDNPVNAGVYHIANADDQGVVRLERIAPGFHGLAVGEMGDTLELLLIDLKPRENRTVHLTLEGRRNQHNPQGLLQRWREANRPRRSDEQPDKELAAEVAALSSGDARGLRKAVRANLAVLPAEMGWGGWLTNELQLLTALAMELKDKESLSNLKGLLERLRSGERSGVYRGRPTAALALVEAVISLEGDEAVDFLAEVAGNPEGDRASRMAALLGLGQIATEKSAAAFQRLRDAAYALPGAPPRKEAYTHAERMAEAAHFVLWVMTAEDSKTSPRLFDPAEYSGATVSEDYSEGRLHTVSLGGWTELMFRRVGDEWLLMRVGNTIS